MKRVFMAGVAIAMLCGVATGFSAQAAPANAPNQTLQPFRSEAEFRDYLKRLQRARPRAVAPPAPASAPMEGAPADSAAAPSTQEAQRDESITNTQEAGVDEGGIVKVRGDMLVILRRGRLFTVSTAGGGLEPIDSINAFPPGANARGDWYDEMLISGDRVIVIGYSYSRGGTEINRFRLTPRGNLRFEDAYHLRSNDYYSSRNYASRLIGSRLIVYSPLYIPYDPVASLDWMPGVRRWSGQTRGGFQRIVGAREIYLPRMWRDPEGGGIDAIHTVTDCDLAAPVLRCRGRSVLGPAGRTFYVSANAVYVWVTAHRWNRRDDDDERAVSSLLYRLPLDGRAPSAIGVRGAPVDQFSFREDWNDGRLNVLVRSEGGGDAMWNPEFAQGRVALLQMPLWAFGDGGDEASQRYYRRLPSPSGESYTFQNRFVGDYVLYGSGGGWGRPRDRASTLVVAGVRHNDVAQIQLAHGVDRIDAMGRDAVVIGSDARDLHFQAVELTSGGRPVLGDRYTLRETAQGETRSHAFFFKPEPRTVDATAGVLGLPVARAGRPGHRQLVENSAAILFIRRANRSFRPLGELGADSDGVVDDSCQASCVDWYGNARPIFLRGRTFALMGYELVEGEIGERSIREVRRVNFAPGWWDR